MSIYINGSDAGGSYSGSGAGIGYLTTGVGRIGSNGSAFFSGAIAECGFWSVSLTANEFASLAAGACPSTIRPASLLAYWPLYGLTDPEVDLSGNAFNGDVSGGSGGPTAANHAPVVRPYPVAA
jgi:hypothetical protein